MFDGGDDDTDDLGFPICRGKTKFDSARLAKSIAKRRSRNGKKGEAYRCPHCRYWHIGHRMRWRRPEKDHENAQAAKWRYRPRKVHAVARPKVPKPQPPRGAEAVDQGKGGDPPNV